MRELEKEWQKEVQAHKEIAKCNHSNIIKFMTAITRDYERYLMFEWANGGNLREFWAEYSPRLTKSLVEDILLQLRGLADALEEIHSKGFRHGDMKPENVLRIKTPGNDSAIGTLKICDMGLTKYHYLATQLRQQATDTKFTTFRYEPPESVEENKTWSRRYDTWSIGCIILEFIVWMVYGTRQLNTFNDEIVNEFGKECHYFQMEKRNGVVSSRVHEAVCKMMDKLAQRPECKAGNTALGDLLGVVRTRLLVVRLGDLTSAKGKRQSLDGNAQTQTRADSMTVKMMLHGIINRGKRDPLYWLQGEGDDNIQGPAAIPEVEPEPESAGSLPLAEKGSSMVSSMLTGSSTLSTNWDFPVDNDFAKKIVSETGMEGFPPKVASSTHLCANCLKLQFWTPRFSIIDSWERLEKSRHGCDFCKMRWEISSHLDHDIFPALRFDREKSMINLNGSYPPVLSIRRSLEPLESQACDLQIGMTQLPKIASPLQFHILQQFLSDCDTEHAECQPRNNTYMPTRLLRIGTQESSVITLYETQPADVIRYIAFSHPWGTEPHFCTNSANIAAHRMGIDFEQLPVLFQDAISATRGLGLQYLWIDSICIIQGDDGDFEQEAEKMENVFSYAFCVIAASSAHGQNDGFLTPHERPRQCLIFRPQGLPAIYLSRFMDDFEKDVLDAPLNKRGWVFQERALARRTIYFTDSQTYWECGRGVRCETLTKMDNEVAGFLGDPNFAAKLGNKETRRGKRINRYQNLYRQYTRLTLTRTTDRPLAIAGLERRLIQSLEAKGGFGLFDDGWSLFQRSLLWQRETGGKPLDRIPTNESAPVPSWSWMAYNGAIDFVEMPFGKIDWFQNAIQSPWASGDAHTWRLLRGKGSPELKAWARSFTLTGDEWTAQNGIMVVCDTHDSTKIKGEDLMWVVLGRDKEYNATEETTHYVLVIAISEGRLYTTEGRMICRRVGVGLVKGKRLNLESSAQAVAIR
ncbi:hypothetical protein F5883DRAFT_531251 [Diaporthe sp. PMI_573]|nr:hypothetical protein F5883DRAFT_531251 [Diaporthaceae sp. PMI_573]